jgi:hypothetical protein
MLRFIVRNSYLVALLLVASFAVAQTEFSADMVSTDKPDKAPTKIYFAKDKMRIDAQDRNPKGGGSVIWTFATQTMTVLMAQQHMYMEMPAQTMQQRGMYNFFRTGDVENACSDWANAQREKGASCHKVGSENVNGRDTVKYETTNAGGDISHFWLDPKLRFPVKWQGKNSGGELRNIQEGSQPSSLFEIPAGFTKFDMGAMMGGRAPQ